MEQKGGRRQVTREEAIEILEYIHDLLHEERYKEFEESDVPALRMAIAALRNEPRWISVEERLPEPGQMVLVYCDSRMRTMHVTVSTYMQTYSKVRRCYWSRRIKNVTHWMPLPEPPEVEG